MTTRICHLATPAEWQEAQALGSVRATFDTEGFVHCSTPAQLTGTIERHFEDVDELQILVLDPASLGDELRWEESRPGEVFPHLYRPIATVEVLEVVAWRRASDGTVALPPALAGEGLS